MIRTLSSLTRSSSNFLKRLNLNYVPSRTTIVVERENPVPVSKIGKPKELNEDAYIYKQVDNLAFKKLRPLKVIIVRDVPEKNLLAGMVCDLKRGVARNLIFYKNAVYASEENLEEYKELLDDRIRIEKAKRKKWLREYFASQDLPVEWADLPLSIRKTKAMLDDIKKMFIPILDTDSDWKVDKETISYFFFTQHGIVVPTEAIELSQDSLNTLGIHPITVVIEGGRVKVRVAFEVELVAEGQVARRQAGPSCRAPYLLRAGHPLALQLLAPPLPVPVSPQEVEAGGWSLSQAHILQALADQGLEVDEVAIQQMPQEQAATTYGLYHVKIQYNESESALATLPVEVCPQVGEEEGARAKVKREVSVLVDEGARAKVKREVSVLVEPELLKKSDWTFEKKDLAEIVRKQLLWDVSEESLEMVPEVISQVGRYVGFCKVNDFMRVKFDILVKAIVADVPDDIKIELLELMSKNK